MAISFTGHHDLVKGSRFGWWITPQKTLAEFAMTAPFLTVTCAWQFLFTFQAKRTASPFAFQAKLPASLIAATKSSGASCGRLWPMPPVSVQRRYLPVNRPA